MSSLGEKLKHELSELIPVTLFFVCAFNLLALTGRLMLHQYGIKPSSVMTATVLALVVAKVVVIADHFKLVNRFPEKPLAYNVVWKTLIYFSASFAFRYIEHLVRARLKTDSLAQAHHHLMDEVVWPHFWAIQIWLFILLLVYCTARELVRAVGRERVVRLYFHDPKDRVENTRP